MLAIGDIRSAGGNALRGADAHNLRGAEREAYRLGRETAAEIRTARDFSSLGGMTAVMSPLSGTSSPAANAEGAGSSTAGASTDLSTYLAMFGRNAALACAFFGGLSPEQLECFASRTSGGSAPSSGGRSAASGSATSPVKMRESIGSQGEAGAEEATDSDSECDCADAADGDCEGAEASGADCSDADGADGCDGADGADGCDGADGTGGCGGEGGGDGGGDGGE